MEDLRYPIGKFVRPQQLTAVERGVAIEAIAALPGELRRAIAGLGPEQLDTPYRPDGWTVRQVVHHVPDSHLNAYTRCKLALTENEPTIKPYDEARWAELGEARTAPPEVSLALLEALHRRWVLSLRSLGDADWERVLLHPDSGRLRVDVTAALYAWHGRHHVGHITALRRREGWG